MKKQIRKILFLLAGILLGVGVVLWFQCGVQSDVDEESTTSIKTKSATIEEVEPEVIDSTLAQAIAEQEEIERREAAEEKEKEKKKAEEEAREEAEEKLVEAFDAKIDSWMEPKKGGVKLSDVSSFVKDFKALPKSRKNECIHRALNLIPDENVMLLLGVLMDRTIEKEYVETVFNDILNRDEDVKKPVLKEILKDKKHPCWVDAAWILDATGELKKK